MQAGFGSARITPPLGMSMEGLGQQGGIAAIHDDLFVRALYLRHAGREALLLGADLLFFERREVDRLKGAIGRRLDLPPGRIFLNVSHTHAGPRLTRWAYTGVPDADYLDEVEAGYVAAATQAVAEPRDVSLWAGVGRTELPVSRRRLDTHGRAQWAPSRAGVICGAVPVFLLRTADGAVVSLVFSVSCHPSMIYSLDVSADYPGAAVRLLNERYHTAGALFLQGAGGDSKPRQVAAGEERWRPGTWEEMEEAGGEVAEAVCAVVDGGLVEVAPDLRRARRCLRFPLDALPGRAELERQARGAPGQEARRPWAEEMLARLDRPGGLVRDLEVDLHALQLGRGLRLIGVEAEVVGELGNLIRAEYNRGVTFPLGYTDGCRAYLPASRMIPEGGYEVDSYWEYHLPAPLAPGTDEVLRAGLAELRDSGEMPNEDCTP
jgi:hypothetical protein